jgi:Protein of unknown function (DUF4232)
MILLFLGDNMPKLRYPLALLTAAFGLVLAAFVLTGVSASATTTSSACGNSSVAVSNSPSQSATGHSSLVLLFKNVGGAACTLTGYPGLDALGGSNQVLVHAKRTLFGFMGGAAAVTTVTLAPGGSASATVEWLNFNPATSGDCTFSKSIAATPPNTTKTVNLPASVSICQLQVHPVVAGTTGQGGMPTGAPAGSAGLAATNSSSTEQGRVLLAAVGGGLLLLGTVAMRRRRTSVAPRRSSVS